ncbi:hypothetical protein EDB84DRAFT_1567062 [Lactarius hengduanensis]|nr:hypothetical protein EDB84DRAFT_1567062 [Lactarius hengduanensis]
MSRDRDTLHLAGHLATTSTPLQCCNKRRPSQHGPYRHVTTASTAPTIDFKITAAISLTSMQATSPPDACHCHLDSTTLLRQALPTTMLHRRHLDTAPTATSPLPQLPQTLT